MAGGASTRRLPADHSGDAGAGRGHRHILADTVRQRDGDGDDKSHCHGDGHTFGDERIGHRDRHELVAKCHCLREQDVDGLPVPECDDTVVRGVVQRVLHRHTHIYCDAHRNTHTYPVAVACRFHHGGADAVVLTACQQHRSAGRVGQRERRIVVAI